MSTSRSHNSTNSTATTTVSDQWEKIPCVQYGFPDEKGPTRAPKLRTIYEPVPDDASTVSPVYGLTPEQWERQEELESGYEIAGGYTSIATELQDECEAEDQVLYPIHIESDEYLQKGPTTLIEWFREFVEDYLGVSFHTCTRYFSGHRSIHIHVPRFVSGESQRERLKELAEAFCDETEAELDCGLYSSKRMFRLPGVEHSKTGLRKVEIEPEWDHTRIIREASKDASELPESYANVLQKVFISQQSLLDSTKQSQLADPLAVFRVLDSKKTILEIESDKKEIDVPLVEQTIYPTEPAEAIKWLQYNAKEFSPYALASGNPRSVAVVTTIGGAFARKDVRNGTTLIPAYFHGAQGCAGKEFTKDQEHAPLQLSKTDYEKWEKRGVQTGDHVVIIGGQSRESVIIQLDAWLAVVVGHLLRDEGGSRQAARDYLESEGYNTGKSGTGEKRKGKDNSTETQESGGTDQEQRRLRGSIRPILKPGTAAARLQQRAEQDGIETLSHIERGKVACRVLGAGWEPAWDWFKMQYGPKFKPVVTWEQFNSVVQSYPEYDHVEVPSKPQ